MVLKLGVADRGAHVTSFDKMVNVMVFGKSYVFYESPFCMSKMKQ